MITVAKELEIAADGNTEELTFFYLLGTMSHRIKKSEDNIAELKLVQDRLRKAIDYRSPDVLGDQPLHMSNNIKLKPNFFLEQVKSVVQNKEAVASAEQFVADRPRFFQEAVQEPESEDNAKIEAFMREGCEVMNELVVRAHGEKARRMPSHAEYSIWLAAQKDKIEGIVDNNYKQNVVATRSFRDTIAAVDEIFHDLLDTNKVPKPPWEDTVNSSPAECTSFFRTLPALFALGIVNHENKCKPPYTTDTPLAFKSWLQGRQIEIRSKWNPREKMHESEVAAVLQAIVNLDSSTSQLLHATTPSTATSAAAVPTLATCETFGKAGTKALRDAIDKLKKDGTKQLQLLVDKIVEMADLTCRCTGAELQQWRHHDFETWFNTTSWPGADRVSRGRRVSTSTAVTTTSSHGQARKIYYLCLRSIHLILHREGQWVNERNAVRAVYWIEDTTVRIGQTARERARDAMAVIDQLEQARTVTEDADDMMDTMERTIAKAKGVVSRQSGIIQQLRQTPL